MGESARKVLLIGLGGTGCAVVSAVKERVGNRDRSIQFLGFDTDSNRELSDNLTVIRTAREANVTEMLMRIPKWREWFPDSPLLLERNMLRGAGQVRALSRLAFKDLLLDNPSGIPELDRAIEQLRNEEGNVNDGIKIMIVSSFAGGTGAGMFLQMPLYLRQHIKHMFPKLPIMIRGLFALPDVFMGHELNEVQRESMYANAYACLKELSLINNICMSKDESLDQYDIKIDNLFDSRKILAKARKAKEENKLNEIATAERKPYDFIFFVDNVNSNNNTIGGSTESYIEQMADITYMQVYSPMSNTTDSREDNLILTKMMSNGKSMYGSAASTLMVYPYDDILTYFTSKATKEMISKRWRYIDTQYEKMKEDLDRKRRFDSNIPKIERGQGFLSIANDLISSNRKEFNFLKEAAFEKNAKDKKLKAKSDLFISSLVTAIEKTLESDEILKAKRDKCDSFTLTVKKDATSADIAKKIANAEEALLQFKEVIEDRTQSLYHTVAEKFVPDSLNSPYAQSTDVYNIFSMLKMRNDEGKEYGIHPLAIRYLLYLLISELQKKRSNARSKATGYAESIHDYYNDKDEDTPGIQGWADMVPPEKRKLLRMSNADALQYLSEYKDGDEGYGTQLANLKDFCKFRLAEAVYEELIKRLQTISAQFEKMFLSIKLIEDDIEETLKQLDRQFALPGASKTYLCASPAYLEKTYQRSGVSIDEDQSNSLFDTILKTMYKEAMSELKLSEERVMLSDREIELIEKRRTSSVKKLFRESILPQNREKIRRNTIALLDISAYEALKKEVDYRLEEKALAEGRGEEITEQEREKERQDLLMEVYRKTAPYLTYNKYHVPDPENQNDKGTSLSSEPHYWGINADVYDDMKKDQGDVEKFMSPAGTKQAEISRSDMYSKYEIQCYRGLYGVQLTEIPKFRESDDEELQGEFYKNYCSRIRSMVLCQYGTVEEGVTPHIDIRWHNRQYLPMIDNLHEQAGGMSAAKAMWRGLVYHTQCIKEERNTKTGRMDAWAHFPEFRGEGLISAEKYSKRPLTFNGKRIRKTDFYEMYQAFVQDSIMTDQMLEVTKTLFDFDCATALRANEIRFYGYRSLPFTASLIGNTRDDVPVEDEDEEIVDEAFNTNALEIAGRIIKDRRSTPQDKMIIMKTLVEIIDEFEDAVGLPYERKEDLLGLIFTRSPFVLKKNRKGAEDALIPPFAEIMEKYDRRNNKPETKGQGKKETTKADADVPKKRTSSGKTTASKTTTAKKATPAKKTASSTKTAKKTTKKVK